MQATTQEATGQQVPPPQKRSDWVIALMVSKTRRPSSFHSYRITEYISNLKNYPSTNISDSMSTITGNGNKGRNPKAKITDSRVNDKPVATSSASQKDKKKFEADVKARMIERLHKGRSDPRVLRSITVARGCSSDGKGCAACRANTR
ncbi:hypothetical protein WAI453_003266 [Rhynchosporium graminicola]